MGRGGMGILLTATVRIAEAAVPGDVLRAWQPARMDRPQVAADTKKRCSERVLPWLRALTALYTAFGHSQLHRHADAARWLRRAKRLHPECVLLPEYEARIAAARDTAMQPVSH